MACDTSLLAGQGRMHRQFNRRKAVRRRCHRHATAPSHCFDTRRELCYRRAVGGGGMGRRIYAFVLCERSPCLLQVSVLKGRSVAHEAEVSRMKRRLKFSDDDRQQVACHASHVTRHTSHVTRHTSHVTRHMSHVARHTSHITRHTSHVTRRISFKEMCKQLKPTFMPLKLKSR